MKTCPVIYRVLLCCLLAGLLVSCDTEKTRESDFARQKTLFTLSLNLVESAGSRLQRPGLSQAEVDQAMRQMDEGLKQAFKVDVDFLARLDVRLPRLYQDMFIQGVENYRLGAELADRQKQLQGLDLLSQWSHFWQFEKKAVQDKMLALGKSD